MEGQPSRGLVFRHADGTLYGGRALPQEVELRTAVFQGLRGLGFRESDVRRALDHCAPHVGWPTPKQELLRMALELLTKRAA